MPVLNICHMTAIPRVTSLSEDPASAKPIDTNLVSISMTHKSKLGTIGIFCNIVRFWKKLL